MQWFDLALGCLMLGVFLFELRQETGRALLDTVAALGAYRLTNLYDEPLTRALGWPGMTDSGASPVVQFGLFAGLLVVGLLISRLLHKHSRWSMDRLDPVFGALFGVVLAGVIGHTSADLATRMTMSPGGEPAHFIAASSLASELREFKSYRVVIQTFDSMRYDQP